MIFTSQLLGYQGEHVITHHISTACHHFQTFLHHVLKSFGRNVKIDHLICPTCVVDAWERVETQIYRILLGYVGMNIHNQWIGVKENLNRKPRSDWWQRNIVSCSCSLQTIHLGELSRPHRDVTAIMVSKKYLYHSLSFYIPI